MSALPSESSPLTELRTILAPSGEITAEGTARVLPRALRIAREKNPALVDELRPITEELLLDMVRERPAVLVDILFPVILPAIRRSIAMLLQSMIDELNQVLARKLSFQSLRWRIEALRTGRSYAEVALLRSVRFEVVDVFLVHRDTGLLILHASRPKAHVQDAATVSSLLSSIQDYMRESFRLSDSKELNRIQIGEYSMWIEQGPYALIAARTHGPTPNAFPEQLQAFIELIHREHSSELENFVGDPDPFRRFQGSLEKILRAESEGPTPSPRYCKMTYALLALPLLLLIGWGTWATYRNHGRNVLVRELVAVPGVLVTDSYRTGGKIVVEGFRDPLSAITSDPEKVDLRLRPYLSLDPTLASLRAAGILSPPSGAEVSLGEDSVLVVRGEAPYAWLKKVHQEFLRVPGAVGVREEGFRTTEEKEFRAFSRQIEDQRIYFARGSSRLRGGDGTLLSQVITSLQYLTALASNMDRLLVVDVVGDVDSTGTDATNALLGPERAAVVAERLRRSGISANVAQSPALPQKTADSRLDYLRRQVALRIRMEEYPWREQDGFKLGYWY